MVTGFRFRKTQSSHAFPGRGSPGAAKRRTGPGRLGHSRAPRALGPLVGGALEALGVTASLVAFGVGWAALEERAAAGVGPYPPGVERNTPTHELWLVDGFNALHAVVLGGRDRTRWWTESRRVELLDRLTCSAPPDAEVVVVFDARTPRQPEERPEPDHRIRQVFARSADDWLVRRIADERDPGRVAVVTADRRLAARVRLRGARVVTPADLLSPRSG